MFDFRKTRALINRKSGFRLTLDSVIGMLREEWDTHGGEFDCLETKSKEDGKEKARQAIRDGVETLIVLGGDGTINSIGAELIGSDVAMAVIPTGSGNGFARHFGIPLNPRQAARALKAGQRTRIDVGFAEDHPFLVTCGLAWEPELVKGFKTYPLRGRPSYIVAGVTRYFTYSPQNFQLDIDGESVTDLCPRILTAANLNQYGAGMKIAPDARPDDGLLDLLAIPETDILRQLIQVSHLMEGNLWEVQGARRWKFQNMTVQRERNDPIQIDGELLTAGKDFAIRVVPSALDIVTPAPGLRRKPMSVFAGFGDELPVRT